MIANRRKSEVNTLKEEGNRLFRAGDYYAAISCYTQALNVAGNKPDPVLFSNTAAGCLKVEMYPQAERTARTALRGDHKNVKARYRRGMARMGMKRYRGAIVDFKTLIAHGHGSDEVRKALRDAEKALDDGLNTLSDEDYASDDYAYPGFDQPMDDDLEQDQSGTSDCEHAGNGIACRAYNHSGCSRGSKSCPFSHKPDKKSVRDDLGKNVCMRFLLNSCKTGAEKCAYSHTRAYLPEWGWWHNPETLEANRRFLAMYDGVRPDEVIFTDMFFDTGSAIPYEGEAATWLPLPVPPPRPNEKRKNKKKIQEQTPAVSSDVFVMLVVLEDDGFWHEIHDHLLKALRSKTTLKQATAKAQVQALLATPGLAGILVVDAGIARKANASIADELAAYVKRGGTVVIGGQFSNHITPKEMKTLTQKFGLPWTMGDYHRTTHARNPGSATVQRNPSLPKSYSMKAVHIAGADSAAALYGPTDNSRIESHVFAPEKIGKLTQYPAVHTRVGQGYLGYIGDVNGENDSTAPVLAMLGLLDAPLPSVQPAPSQPQPSTTPKASTSSSTAAPKVSTSSSTTAPRASTSSASTVPTALPSSSSSTTASSDKTIAIIALSGMLDMFESIHAHLVTSLKDKAKVVSVTTLAQAKKVLQAPAPAGVLIVDAAVTEKKYKDFVPSLVSYVGNGGSLVFAGAFSSFARPLNMNKLWKAFGMGWEAASYHRMEFEKELDHATVARNPSLPTKYSMKALQLKNIGSSGLYSEGLPESPIVHKRIRSGYLGYVGDVNGENETTPCVLAMLGLLDAELLQ